MNSDNENIVSPSTGRELPSRQELVSIVQYADATHPHPTLKSNAQSVLNAHVLGVKKRNLASKDDASRLPFASSEQKLLWLPCALMPHQDELGIVFALLANMLGYTTFYYENAYHQLNHSDETEKICIGMKIGVTDLSNIILSKKKSEYELGRALAFAIRVRGYFRKTNSLTESALAPNNFFFGNYPQEVIGKSPVGFRIRSLIHSLTGLRPYADALYKTLVHLLEEVNLQFVTADTIPGIIKSNLISIQSLEHRYYHKSESIVGKGRKSKTVTEYKGPRKPGSSTLLLKEESKFISELLTPFFECTAKYHDIDKFYDAICEHTFRKITSFMRDVFEVKWHITQEYASVTTKRLAEARSLGDRGDSKKSKANVSRDDLVALLMKRNYPGERFAQEVLKLIPHSMGKFLVEVAPELRQAFPGTDKLKEMLAAFFRSDITSEKMVWKVPIFPEKYELPKKDLFVNTRTARTAEELKSDFPALTKAEGSDWKTVTKRGLRPE